MALVAVGKSEPKQTATREGSLSNILLVFIPLLLLFITYQASEGDVLIVYYDLFMRGNSYYCNVYVSNYI